MAADAERHLVVAVAVEADSFQAFVVASAAAEAVVALLHVYVLLLAKSACQFLTSACLIVFADALLLADADVVLTLVVVVAEAMLAM